MIAVAMPLPFRIHDPFGERSPGETGKSLSGVFLQPPKRQPPDTR
jgi:hypothetical protein